MVLDGDYPVDSDIPAGGGPSPTLHDDTLRYFDRAVTFTGGGPGGRVSLSGWPAATSLVITVTPADLAAGCSRRNQEGPGNLNLAAAIRLQPAFGPGDG